MNANIRKTRIFHDTRYDSKVIGGHFKLLLSFKTNLYLYLFCSKSNLIKTFYFQEMSYDLKGHSSSQEKKILNSRSMEVKSKVTFFYIKDFLTLSKPLTCVLNFMENFCLCVFFVFFLMNVYHTNKHRIIFIRKIY